MLALVYRSSCLCATKTPRLESPLHDKGPLTLRRARGLSRFALICPAYWPPGHGPSVSPWSRWLCKADRDTVIVWGFFPPAL